MVVAWTKVLAVKMEVIPRLLQKYLLVVWVWVGSGYRVGMCHG